MDIWGHEERRVIDNLAQHYDAWIQATRAKGHGHMQWKRSKGREYLYRIIDGQGNGHSLGVRDAETERLFAEHRQARLTERRTWMSLKKDLSIYRALRLPSLAPEAIDLLLELDLHGWLGRGVLVVGTNAMAAYELEAGAPFARGLDATEDFDLTWGGQPPGEGTLLEAVRRADRTYTVDTERPFQARNADGYEVELLLAQSIVDQFPNAECFRPIPLEEQDWLLLGKPVSQVIGDRRKPARLVVPDPRYFALHKLWLADKPSRKATKREKDRSQGEAVLAAVRDHMPAYPMDAAFVRTLPAALVGSYTAWLARSSGGRRRQP